MSQSSRPTNVIDQVLEAGAIAVLRLQQHEHVVAVGERLVAAGLPVMEVTFDHPEAPESLAALNERLPSAAVVGGGTILNPDQVAQCKAAGGRFCVSPNTDPLVIRACLDQGMEPIPGAQTPTEVAVAVEAGATLVKLFPAGPLGVGYLRALRGPFRHVHFVPTGGIRHGEVGEWLAAGAAAVGLGSDLVPAEPSEAGLGDIAHRADIVARQVAQHRETRRT